MKYSQCFSRMPAVLGLVLACASQSMPAYSNTGLTGNILYKWCTSENEVETALCGVFILGVTQGHRTGANVAGLKFFNMVVLDVPDEKFKTLRDLKTSQLLGYCIPNEASGEQVTDIVILYLKDHPEDRHEPASSIVYSALESAFPCTKE